MGYLRGTKGSRSYVTVRPQMGPKTLRQEVRALKRAQARYRNAPHYFLLRSTLNSSGATSWSREDIDLTDAFTSTGTYHDNVTGDEYLNNNLQTKVDVSNDVIKCRMVIYVPKNPLVTFTPTLDQAGFTTQPDPNSFWILKDVYINHNTDVFNTATTYWVNLRGLKTIFNTDSNIVEKGRVRILFLYFNQSNPSGNGSVFISNQLSITDK